MKLSLLRFEMDFAAKASQFGGMKNSKLESGGKKKSMRFCYPEKIKNKDTHLFDKSILTR